MNPTSGPQHHPDISPTESSILHRCRILFALQGVRFFSGILLTLIAIHQSSAAIIDTEDAFTDSVQNNWIISKWNGNDIVSVQSSNVQSGTNAISASLAPWGALTLDRRTANWSTVYSVQPDEFTDVSF